MDSKKKILIFFLVLLSLPVVNSAPVTNLTITLMNPPAITNKDLNFRASWNGVDVNTLYWKFDSDGNVSRDTTLVDTNNFYDFESNNVNGWIDADLAGDFNTTSVVAHGGTYSGDGNASARFVIPITITNDLNVEMWVRVTATVNEGSLVGFVNTANNYSIAIGFNRSLNDKFVVFNGGNRDLNGTNPNIVANKWYKLVFTQKIGKADVYIFDSDGTTELAHGFDVALANDMNRVVVYADPDSGETYIDDIKNQFYNTTTFTSPQYEQHTFSTLGLKTIQLTAQNPDGNASTKLDLNIYGSLRLTVWDENTGAKLSNATIDFNGGTYSLDSNAVILIPLQNLATASYNINVDGNSEYPSRDFYYDLNSFSYHDLNLLLLATVKGSNRAFKIYQPNQTTLIINSYVQWNRTDAIINGISQRRKTDALAQTNFFGQEDANYSLTIYDTVSNIVRTYNGTIVTVNIPKDARTLIDLNMSTNPFNIQVGGLAGQTYSNLVASKSFKIYSDTTSYYSVFVDANSGYYDNTYSVKTLGGQATYILQPYLTAIVDGIRVIFLTYNSLTNQILGNVTIKVYRFFNNTTTLLQEATTDYSGQTTITVIPSYDYNLAFYYNSELVFSANYSPISSDSLKKAYLGITNVGGETPDEVYVDFNAGANYIFYDASASTAITFLSADSNISNIDVNFYVGSVLISEKSYTITDANTLPFTITTTLNTLAYDTNSFVEASIEVTTDNGSSDYRLTYPIVDTDYKDLLQYGQDAVAYLGFTLAGIISVLVALFLIGFLTKIQPFSSAGGQTAIVILVLYCFSLINWVNGNLLLFGSFIAIILTWCKASLEGY